MLYLDDAQHDGSAWRRQLRQVSHPMTIHVTPEEGQGAVKLAAGPRAACSMLMQHAEDVAFCESYANGLSIVGCRHELRSAGANFRVNFDSSRKRNWKDTLCWRVLASTSHDTEMETCALILARARIISISHLAFVLCQEMSNLKGFLACARGPAILYPIDHETGHSHNASHATRFPIPSHRHFQTSLDRTTQHRSGLSASPHFLRTGVSFMPSRSFHIQTPSRTARPQSGTACAVPVPGRSQPVHRTEPIQLKPNDSDNPA